MLYRLLKKVNQSLRTPFSFSDKSSHSDLQSSGLSEDWASAREASFPANTGILVSYWFLVCGSLGNSIKWYAIPLYGFFGE